MIARAGIKLDRDYFELCYRESVGHRLKFRKYGILFAALLTILGVGMAFVFRHQWLVGGLLACAGVYELAMATTHRKRWVDARVASNCTDQKVDIVFVSEALTTTSPNCEATMRFAGFSEFTVASHGFFLIPEAGMSIYVPRAAVEPAWAYPELVALLSAAVESNDMSSHG